MWTKTKYYCAGKTVRGNKCWSEVPYEGLYCWHHRGQKDVRKASSTSD